MRKYFISGLVILLPLAITIFVLNIIIQMLVGPFEDFALKILSTTKTFENGFLFFSRAGLLSFLSRFLILLALLITILAIGIVTEYVFFKSFFHFGDKVLRSIPFVRKIYSSCKDFTDLIFSSNSGSFEKVALSPFPAQNQFGIGIVTREFESAILSKDGKPQTFASVLVPGTPNPTVGFLLLVPKNKLKDPKLKPDEALRYIISCGTSYPGKVDLGSIKIENN